MEELILKKPDVSYAEQIAELRQEYLDVGSSMDGCSVLRRTPDPIDFINHCKLNENKDTVSHGLVPATLFMLVRVEDNRILGMIQIRHCFNEFLEKYGGHIGYSIRPTDRQKGYAKEMLKMALEFCKELKLNNVLISCIDGNIASEKTIVANGGIYENTVLEPSNNVYIKRFWINLE